MAETKITGGQVRMARAFLHWSIADLANKAGVGMSTVRAIEAPDGEAQISPAGIATTAAWRAESRAESISKIAAALTAAGITFLSDDGKHGPGIRGGAKRRK